MRDRNFDDIAEKFVRNIYGTTKGIIRKEIVWRDLTQLLASLPQRPLSVLDAGGGEGVLSGQLAAMGHQVVLCDISEEMVKRAERAAEEKGLLQQMTFIHSSVQDVSRHLAQAPDLILFHAVLEWVADPKSVLQHLYDCLAPGGALSLMFYNYHGLLFRNVLLGNLQYVEKGMPKKKRRSLSPDNPLHPEQVYQWIAELGMTISGKSGIRVFHDYMHNKMTEQDLDALLALEQRYCRQEPYINFGRYIHVMAHKPHSKDTL